SFEWSGFWVGLELECIAHMGRQSASQYSQLDSQPAGESPYAIAMIADEHDNEEDRFLDLEDVGENQQWRRNRRPSASDKQTQGWFKFHFNNCACDVEKTKTQQAQDAMMFKYNIF
ncbi:unnamed protein product, partial [Heterosigma akashiwo]